MIKIYCTLSLILFSCIHLSAQTKAGTSSAASSEPEVKIYNTALQYGDYEVAKNAIYALMAKYPENRSYLDTLSRLYFSLGNYAQCVNVGNEYLKNDKENVMVQELVALSENSRGNYRESLEGYEKLVKKTGSPYYAYQLAVNQYMLKRFGECALTAEAILKEPASEKQEVSISVDQKNSQKVPLKAAAYNLLGVIEKELNHPDKAKTNFEAALKAFPDFELAKNNLKDLNKN